MLNDMTFGQFFPIKSFVHAMDSRIKLILSVALIVIVFICANFYSLAIISAFTLLIMIITKIPIKMYLKTIKPILFFILLTSVLNMFYITGETILFQWSFITIYAEGVIRAVFVSIRIFVLIIISAALTYTTSPTSLTDAIESLLKPLSKLGIDIHTFAMMMTIALRFIPTLIEETQKIMSAQKARGADMDSGGIMKKIKAVLPVLIPLLVSSIRRAKDLADAMECRCYHGGEGRTRLKILKSGYRDAISIAFVCVVTGGIISANMFL